MYPLPSQVMKTLYGQSPTAIYPTRGWTPLVLQMNTLTLTHLLRACNGHFPADSPGKYTYNRNGQASMIDYILVDVEIWSRIKNFSVQSRSESDHNPLALDLDCPELVGIGGLADNSHTNLTLVDGGRRVRWGTIAQSIDKTATMYKSIIPFLENACAIVENSGGAENTLRLGENHQQMVTTLADFLYTSKTTNNSHVRGNSLWYNQTCREAKHALLTALRAGHNVDIRESRAHFKKTLNEAKSLWEANRWQDIKKALDAKDMRGFWNLVRSGKREGNLAIKPNLAEEVWRSHFKTLYSKPKEESITIGVSAPDHHSGPFSNVVLCTKSEVSMALAKLPPNKAPGLDRIPGDLFRN